MAENLTFARPRATEAWHPEASVFDELKFYSATGTDTHEVFRFVGQSGNATASEAAREFAAVTGAGAYGIGVLVPHVHDDVEKEYYAAVAVGDKATIIYASTQPVTVEAGAGITAGELKPMTEIQTDATGKGILAASGDRVLMLGLEAFDVTTGSGTTTTYIKGLLAKSGEVLA